ncbi:hypothetical protein ACFSHR_05630 [Azotobacter chroococcum]
MAVQVFFGIGSGPALQKLGYQLHEKVHHHGGKDQIDQSGERERQSSIHQMCVSNLA